jgi:hypothetical protein
MNNIFSKILDLVRNNRVLISHHGYEEMAYDDILFRDVIERVAEGVVVEEYPDYHKGPCVLVLQKDRSGRLIHVVWGIPKNEPPLAALVTAYRPDPARWEHDFIRRKP